MKFFSLLGCLPLLAIASCYSWPFFLLTAAAAFFLSPHCAVWEKKVSTLSVLQCRSLLWILFLKNKGG